MSKCGVILCECNGSLERRISLQGLSRFLHKIAPDIDIAIGNDLCKTGGLKPLIGGGKAHPLVIGACSKIQSKANVFQDLDADNINNPCFTKVVDILGEISSDYSDTEVSDRIKLLLASQISKGFCCNDLLQDNIRVHFSMAQTEITRRNLIASLIPQYEVIPNILHDDCLGDSCQLCTGICPAGAIVSSNNTIKIDKSSCTGCGACVNACPRGAVSYPGYSTVELEREIEALLSNQAELPYRIIAFHCQSCTNSINAGLKHSSPSVFNIKVPSPAIISPLLLLNAFNMGADGIVFIHDEKSCKSRVSEQHMRNTISFIQSMLDRWGIDRNRIGYINSGSPTLDTGICRFADIITSLGHTPFKAAPGSMTFEGLYSLSSIIIEMDKKLHVGEEGILSGEYVPFGVAAVDSTRCSGCNVCAQRCPTGAISTQVSDDSTLFKLIFHHTKCIACGLCVNICPEKCINVNKTLDFSRLSNVGETMFVNEFMYCRNCNRPYSAKSMVDALKRRLEDSGVLNTEWTEYCPSCRVSIQQKR